MSRTDGESMVSDNCNQLVMAVLMEPLCCMPLIQVMMEQVETATWQRTIGYSITVTNRRWTPVSRSSNLGLGRLGSDESKLRATRVAMLSPTPSSVGP
jgi:hypothetical protein